MYFHLQPTELVLSGLLLSQSNLPVALADHLTRGLIECRRISLGDFVDGMASRHRTERDRYLFQPC